MDLYYSFCLILFAGLVQLSSRAAFIAFLLVINGAFPFLLFKGKKRLAFFVTASFFSASTLLIIVNVESFKTRYISELKTDLTNNVKIIENTEPRLARWNVMSRIQDFLTRQGNFTNLPALAALLARDARARLGEHATECARMSDLELLVRIDYDGRAVRLD